jgi:hypothetical protein
VTGAKVSGLDVIRRRLSKMAELSTFKPKLRHEADSVAADARARLDARDMSALAKSVKVTELPRQDGEGFAIGTDEPAGFFVEFGTRKVAENPWLLPALHARLPRLKHNLATLARNVIKSR